MNLQISKCILTFSTIRTAVLLLWASSSLFWLMVEAFSWSPFSSYSWWSVFNTAAGDLEYKVNVSNRHREYAYGHGERGGEDEMYGKSNMKTYITICKIDSQREFAVWLRKLKQGLCINLEEWDGRKVQKGGDILYTYGWFMLRFDRRQQNSVKQLSFNKKINKFKKKAETLFHQQRSV